jgi:parvulin-like peptidyl-prolyl isomerase
MKRALLLLVLAALVVALAAGCGGSSGPKSAPAGSVAVVGGTDVTKADLAALVVQVKASYKAQKRAFPKKSSTDYKSLQDQLIQYLVQLNELEQKAKDEGVTVTDADINARLASVKKQYFGGDDKKYRQALKAQGLTEDAYKQSLHAQILSQKLNQKVTQDVKVSDSDIAAYYKSHGQYQRRSVRHILVNSQSLANKLYTQLKGGADFAKLAKKYSKDPGSAAQGGKLDISRGQTVPEFDQAAFSLKTNEISKPVHTQFGWHIIQPLGPVQKTPLSQVKEQIRQQLLQQKRNDAWTKYIDDMSKSYCSGKIVYQVGYAPTSDPCQTLTASTATNTTTTG